MFAKTDIAMIMRLADAFRGHRGFSLNTCSLRAANSGSLFRKLKSGEQGLTIGRRDRIVEWFDNNWPEDLAWPEEVARPSRATETRAAS